MSTHQMPRLIAFGALAALLLVPAVGRAQTTAPSATLATTDVVVTSTTTPVATSAATTDGPRIAQSGVTRASASAVPAAPPQFRRARQDVVWMVVGGAALVVGSMIGGDAGTIVMVTGGVIGLVGLFRFVQRQ